MENPLENYTLLNVKDTFQNIIHRGADGFLYGGSGSLIIVKKENVYDLLSDLDSKIASEEFYGFTSSYQRDSGSFLSALGAKVNSLNPSMSGLVRIGTATTADSTADVLIGVSASNRTALTIQATGSQTVAPFKIVEFTNNINNNGWQFFPNAATVAQSGVQRYISPTIDIVGPNYYKRWSVTGSNVFGPASLSIGPASTGSNILVIGNGTQYNASGGLRCATVEASTYIGLPSTPSASFNLFTASYQADSSSIANTYVKVIDGTLSGSVTLKSSASIIFEPSCSFVYDTSSMLAHRNALKIVQISYNDYLSLSSSFDPNTLYLTTYE